jgi:DNA-binding GntR family transcriptional regulator
MTKARIVELRDMRLALEGLAAEKAARHANRHHVAELRRIALELATARGRGDHATDRQKIREFHFALYDVADQPTLLRAIEGLWLQTGPYMNLLYPEFISRPHGPQTRARIIRALQAHDGVAARREIENDIGSALSYIADLADEAGNITPVTPRPAVRRRRGADATAALEFGHA